MKKIQKVIRSILVCMTVCLLFSTIGFASNSGNAVKPLKNTKQAAPHFFAEKAKKKVPVYLRIDKYYILFTKPRGPYLNKDGRLMVPLKMVEDLMGGKVTYTDGENQGTVEILNATIQFTVGRDTIDVNGEEKTISAKPVLSNSMIMIPLKSILDNTDIEYKYDAKYNQIHITDIRAKGEILGYPEMDYYESPDENAIKILYYIPTIVREKSGEIDYFKLNIYGKNMTPNPIDQENGEVRIICIQNGGFSDSSSYTKKGTPYSSLAPYEMKRLILGGADEEDNYVFMTARLHPFSSDYYKELRKEFERRYKPK